MNKPKIFVTLPVSFNKDTFFNKKIKESLKKNFNISWNQKQRDLTKSELMENLRDADGCIVGWGSKRLTKEILDNCKNLKFIGVLGGSIKPYVNDYAFEKGITIVNSANIMAKSVAEAVLAYCLTSLRFIPHYNNLMKIEKGWRSNSFFNRGLYGKKVGLVGFGAVGKNIVRLMKPFAVDFLIYDPYIEDDSLNIINAKKSSLEEVISSSDIVSIQAAYTEETHHMFDKKLLSKMKSKSVLVNVARGGLIDEKALYEELKKERFYAVLDVFEEEPLAVDSKLRELKNIILIPHMAGPTIDMRPEMTISIIKDMRKFFSGKEVDHEINQAKSKLMT